jgi:hypothetical protein
MDSPLTRRQTLATLGSGVAVGLSGCLGGGLVGGTSGDPPGGIGRTGGPPTVETERYVAQNHRTLRDAVVSGGVSKDGIPSVDSPTFTSAKESDVRDGAIVFGLARGDDVRAYPQHILVHHEIVNDTVGDTPISVTYCPLTGTAMGFERGETTFGVSGRLLNNNLVMYDRATDSRWPQMLATAISGPHEGDHLREFRLRWTTWREWRDANPETSIMTSETGFARRYGRDPYGGYNPDRGYYEDGKPMFDALHRDDRAQPKRIVSGVRTADGAIAFDERRLADAGVLSGETAPGKTSVLAVFDPVLQTGFAYRNPENRTVRATENGTYTVDGEPHAPDALPLDRLYAFDAMWHAWAGFYPETNYVR